MATNNPKISVYVPKELEEVLKGEKERRNSHSLSAVVVELLEEKLGLRDSPQEPISNAWVEQVNARLAALEAKAFSGGSPQDRKTASPEYSVPKTKDTESGSQIELLGAQSNAPPETQSNEQWPKILSTAEASGVTGIPAASINGSRHKEKMPAPRNGLQIVRFVEKRKVGQRNLNFWEVDKDDTQDASSSPS